MYTLSMYSDTYGGEEFSYATKREALAGKKRLQAQAKQLNDGVVRHFNIERWYGDLDIDMITVGPLAIP